MTCPNDGEYNRKIDRVRLRVTRLMHLTRDRNPSDGTGTPGGAELVRSHSTADREREMSLRLARLADEIQALKLGVEDCERLIRQAWNVAGDFNQVRRHCNHCDAGGELSEAIGFYQGLLNRWRHNVRAAAKSVDVMRTELARANVVADPLVSSVDQPKGPDEAACAPRYAGVAT